MGRSYEEFKKMATAKSNQEVVLLVVSNMVWVWLLATQLSILMAAACLSISGVILGKRINPGGLSHRFISEAKRRGAQLLVKMEEV